ncbi:hypothetical protein PG995_006628 [Apiospora arundinis]
MSSMPSHASEVSFQMAVRDGDMPGAQIEDKELIDLAERMAISDILCVAMIAPRVYDFLKDETTELHDCFDPWHNPTGSSTALQAWTHSIQAYTENKSLDEWRPQLRNPLPEDEVVQISCHQIIGVRDDTWAKKWAPIIQEIVSDYNNIRYGKTSFHKHYLEDDGYIKLWDELSTGAVRLEDIQSTHQLARWMESLKDTSEETGDALERLMTQKIREIDARIRQAIKARALLLEWAQIKMDYRFRSKSVLKYKSPWNEYTWSQTWEKRQDRICNALQINWDQPAQVASKPPSPPKKGWLRMTSTHLHAATGLTVLLAAIPAMKGWSQSEPAPGTIKDADFWWLLAGMVFQLLSLSMFAAGLLSGPSPATSSRFWVYAYVLVGMILSISAFPLYLWVSIRYSSAAMFLSSVDTALLQVQVSLVAFAVAPETKAKED